MRRVQEEGEEDEPSCSTNVGPVYQLINFSLERLIKFSPELAETGTNEILLDVNPVESKKGFI